MNVANGKEFPYHYKCYSEDGDEVIILKTKTKRAICNYLYGRFKNSINPFVRDFLIACHFDVEKDATELSKTLDEKLLSS